MAFTKAQLAAQNAELRLELTAALLTIERLQAEARKPKATSLPGAPDTPEARMAAMQAAKEAAMAGKVTTRAF